MDFIDRINELAARIPKQLDYCTTEEATKNALVLPFINALGYDIFNPTEVLPEFTADVGIKKGEKVDYAILQNGKPIMLFECKWSGADLSKAHVSQLYRYFNVVPDVRFGILTNGIRHKLRFCGGCQMVERPMARAANCHKTSQRLDWWHGQEKSKFRATYTFKSGGSWSETADIAAG